MFCIIWFDGSSVNVSDTIDNFIDTVLMEDEIIRLKNPVWTEIASIITHSDNF